MTMDDTVLAVDLGGTHLRCAIITGGGHIVARESVPTHEQQPGAATLAALTARVRHDHAPSHAVLAVPGRVDRDEGRLTDAPNLPEGWVAELRVDRLRDALGLPVLMGNDADVAAVGEAYFGAGRGADDVAYVTVSTGIGAGVLVGGRIVRPRISGAELGRTTIDLHAARRGEPATVEGLGSGTALARRAREAGLEATGSDFVALVRAGDPTARAVWDDAMYAVGIGIANLVWLFAPQVVVLGGGVGRNGDLVLAPVAEVVSVHGPDSTPAPPLVTAALGDDPGLVGAAGWRRALGPPSVPGGRDRE